MPKLTRDISTAFQILRRVVVPKVTRVAIHVTYDCNQKCKSCDIWAINKDKPELRKQEVTIDEFRTFCDKNPYIVWICLTGGEPYLKKDLKDYIEACCTIPSLRLISISTNGAVPEKIESDVRHFLSNARKDVTLATQVSFEGPESLHDEISGTPGSFKRALDTLHRLNKLSREDSRVRHGAAFTLTYFSQGNLIPTIEALGESCPPPKQLQMGFGQEADYYHWKDYRRVVPDTDMIVKEVKALRGLLSWRDKLDPYSLIEQLYYRKALQLYTNGAKIPKCVACQYTVTIDPYWNVHPCLFRFGYTLGNLRGRNDYDLQELVNSTRKTWKPVIEECNKKSKCWTLCEDYMMIVARPWRAL